MNRAVGIQHLAMMRSALGLYSPPVKDNFARWRINGYRATIIIWTAEEWERMTDRPPDAQFYPCGVWCALRME